MEEQEFEMGENQKALGGCGMVIAFLIIAGVTLYSDVMFIWVMWDYFPQGFLRVGALLGALMTGASILTLLISKSYWFRPGTQTVFAWCFTGLEIVVSVFNILLATSVAKGNAGILGYWGYISPASPMFAAIGWIVIWQVDRATVIRHKHMAMQDKIANSNMAYTLKVHQAQMAVKTQHLKQVSEQLNNVLSSEAVQAQIAQHAERMVAKVLTDVTGMNAFLPARTVQGSGTALPLPESAPAQPVSLAQMASMPESAPKKKGLLGQAIGAVKQVLVPAPNAEPVPPVPAAYAPVPPAQFGPDEFGDNFIEERARMDHPVAPELVAAHQARKAQRRRERAERIRASGERAQRKTNPS